MESNAYDVVVLGSGPAGAVAARRAAQLGLKTLLLEKEQFPRFHIGESLLPYMSGLLHQLGLLEAMKDQGHPVKAGAEFSNTAGQYHRVSFTDQGSGRFHTTFQVDRSRFDRFLQEAAVEAGAELHAPLDEVEVNTSSDDTDHEISFTVNGLKRQARARFIIDASGRAGVLARQFNLRKPVQKLRMVAVYRHYEGLDELNNPGWEGDIQIGNHEDGWIWAIPNAPGQLSVGTVMRKNTLRGAAGSREELFEEHLSRLPRIVERLGDAKPISVQTALESDFCYYAEEVAGNRWFIVGDAAAFVDPVFSGGVYLAMVTGLQAANEIFEITAGTIGVEASRERFTAQYKTGYDTYFRLVQGFYDYEFDFGRLKMELPQHVDDKSVSLLLGGDFWGKSNTFSEELRKRSEWAVFEDFEPTYGCPAYPELELSERMEAPATTDKEPV